MDEEIWFTAHSPPRCLFHSLTAPKCEKNWHALAPSRVHHLSITHPPSVTPRKRARYKPPYPSTALSVWTPQQWLPRPPVPRPRHYAVGSSPGHTNNNDNRWAHARAAARGVAPRAQRNRPAGFTPKIFTPQPTSWLVMQSLSSESFHALLHLVHRVGNGLHRCSIRDTQAVGVAERLAGHEGEQEVLEQVETDVIRVG